MSSRVLPEFELFCPTSLADSINLLGQYGDKMAILAGGTDLLTLMKMGFSPAAVLSLAEVPGLDFVEYDAKQGLRIGAMATMAKVWENQMVRDKYPALWTSVHTNGTPQTRNVATVVGNILRASPSGDCCCAAFAHGGGVVLEGAGDRREVSLDEFWLDYRKTARKPDEVAVELRLDPPEHGGGSAFQALTRSAQDLAKVNAAAMVVMNGKACQKVRLTMGAVAPTPVRLQKCEALLQGQAISEQLLDKVAATVSQEIKPIDDVRSTAQYRSDVAGVLVKRVIQEALHTISAGTCPYSCFMGA